MLDIWNQSFSVFLVRVGAAILLHFCLFVCFGAFVVCIFSDKDQGCSTFKTKLICLHAMNAEQKKQKIVWYGIIASHFEVTSKRGINIHMVSVVVHNAK